MRRLLVTAVALAVMLVGFAAPTAANFSNGPSSAGIVERFDDPGFGVWFDEEDGLVVLANVNSVADACNDIPAGPGDVQLLSLPGDVTVILLHDDDVPLLVVPIPTDDPCLDPDNYPVIATGVGDVRVNDNDVFVSGTRTNQFGSRVVGSVVDDSGGVWSLQAHFRAQIKKDGEFVLTREDIHLVKRG